MQIALDFKLYIIRFFLLPVLLKSYLLPTNYLHLDGDVERLIRRILKISFVIKKKIVMLIREF